MSVPRYPHILQVAIKHPPTRNEKGKFVRGIASNMFIRANYVHAPEGSMLTKKGGRKIEYSGIIYTAPGLPIIGPGAKVKVKDGLTVIAEGDIKHFEEDHFKRTLWL